MIKSITNFLIIFFIFQQLNLTDLKDQNGVNPFCDETLQVYVIITVNLKLNQEIHGI